jgi:hypothetical protein
MCFGVGWLSVSVLIIRGQGQPDEHDLSKYYVELYLATVGIKDDV